MLILDHGLAPPSPQVDLFDSDEAMQIVLLALTVAARNFRLHLKEGVAEKGGPMLPKLSHVVML
eukprot:2725496-Alexandrium_andersonii.AAC.1